MASLKVLSFFFVFSLFTSQIQARDVKFFSKVSPSTAATPATVKVNKQEPQQDQEQEPSFMRETENGAYGLYGNQETTQFPTTTKLAGDAAYTPTTTGESFSGNPNSNRYYNNEQFTDNELNIGENNFKESNFKAQYNDNKYNYYSYKNGEMQGMSGTRFMENGNENNYFQDRYQNSRDNYNYNYGNRGYNNENNFEFDNSMENFQNQNQDDFQENGKYVP